MEATHDKKLRNNPFFVITIASILALLMSLVSFLLYYNSDTRKTVEQLQLNTQQINADPDAFTPKEALSTEYITQVQEKVSDTIMTHSDETDFSAAELTDSALGL